MSQSHALVSPHPADAVGEVLDRRYVLLEVTEGPGAGFYYAAYDMQELTRKRLRLLPDDAGKPSLDWYMVDDFPRQATKVQATKVQAKVQATKVQLARERPTTGPQRPVSGATPPPIPPTLRAVPNTIAAPAAPKRLPTTAPPAAPSSAAATTKAPASPASPVSRLEAAWFAEGEQETLPADPLSFDDVYAGIARQAALDDLARVLSPEDLREHGLE